MAKILVTDDSAFMRVMIKSVLIKEGHDVYEAENGRDMLSVYDKELPDLVTLDITMPEMDGLEALKKLKEKHPDAKVIMCSAMGQQAMVVEAIKHGASSFLVKPFENERVLVEVTKMLS